MEMICEHNECSGCGMCTNICQAGAVRMIKVEHGFFHPTIDKSRCTGCGLCRRVCPVNADKPRESNVSTVYAAWNKNRSVRKESTSGGLYSLLAKAVFDDGGVVVGVRWDASFHAEHFIATSEEQMSSIRGSKYVQSHTGSIYADIQQYLENGKSVLFSGTPCHNHALRRYLNKEHSKLFQVDLICHGIPSDDMFQRYLKERIGDKNVSITNIRLRHKNPYWDYCNVTVDFSDGSQYTMPTVDDPYFTIFNIGYSLRDSCRNCRYTSTHRYGDITLADFWRYKPNSYRLRDYAKGTSCVLINSEKGKQLFDSVRDDLVCEESNLEIARRGNKALNLPFSPPQDDLKGFWSDYEAGMSVANLCVKYVPNRFKKPSLLWLRRIKGRYSWVKHR